MRHPRGTTRGDMVPYRERAYGCCTGYCTNSRGIVRGMKTHLKCPECGHEFSANLSLTSCLRCGHRWIPRTLDVRQCPKCQSVRWDTPREGPRPSPQKPTPGAHPSEPQEDTPSAQLRRLRGALGLLTGKTKQQAEAKILALEAELQKSRSL